MKSLCCALIGIVFAAAPVVRADQAEDLVLKFDTYLDNIVAASADDRATAAADYARALEVVAARMQAEARLDEVILVQAEISRFATVGKVRLLDVATEPTDLRLLQAKYLKRLDDISLERARATLTLVQQFDAQMQAQERQLTATGNISEALSLREARRSVRTRPAVVSAEFEVAARESKTRPVAQPPPDPPEEDEPPPVLQAIAAAATPYWDNPLVKIYGAGSRPPDSGMFYKRLSLTRTPSAPLASEVVVSAMVAEESSTEDMGHTLRKGTRWHLRLALRTSASQGDMSDVRVVCDFFEKAAQSRSGRAEVELGQVSRARLPKLGGETVTVDLNPLEVAVLRSRGGERDSQGRGSEVYGAIVTVLNGLDEILYQGAYPRTLVQNSRTAPNDITLFEYTLEQRRAVRSHWQAYQGAFNAAQRSPGNKYLMAQASTAFERYEVAKQALADAKREYATIEHELNP